MLWVAGVCYIAPPVLSRPLPGVFFVNSSACCRRPVSSAANAWRATSGGLCHLSLALILTGYGILDRKKRMQMSTLWPHVLRSAFRKQFLGCFGPSSCDRRNRPSLTVPFDRQGKFNEVDGSTNCPVGRLGTVWRSVIFQC